MCVCAADLSLKLPSWRFWEILWGRAVWRASTAGAWVGGCSNWLRFLLQEIWEGCKPRILRCAIWAYLPSTSNFSLIQGDLKSEQNRETTFNVINIGTFLTAFVCFQTDFRATSKFGRGRTNFDGSLFVATQVQLGTGLNDIIFPGTHVDLSLQSPWQARGRSTRGYGIGPRAQQHEYQEALLVHGCLFLVLQFSVFSVFFWVRIKNMNVTNWSSNCSKRERLELLEPDKHIYTKKQLYTVVPIELQYNIFNLKMWQFRSWTLRHMRWLWRPLKPQSWRQLPSRAKISGAAQKGRSRFNNDTGVQVIFVYSLYIIFFKDIMSRQIIDILFLLGKILKPCNIYVIVRGKMIHWKCSAQ